MPATATVNGHEVAKTDKYEVVDGNIYVTILLPPMPCMPPNPPITNKAFTVPSGFYNKVCIQRDGYAYALSVQGRRVVLYSYDGEDGGHGCGVVLS